MCILYIEIAPFATSYIHFRCTKHLAVDDMRNLGGVIIFRLVVVYFPT